MSAAEDLGPEERAALGGVWLVDLDLDDGAQSLSCHLDGETGIATASSLPESLSQKKPRWTATVLEDRVSLRLEIGPWQLRGAGERDGLRCAAFSGSVTEGDEDAVCVGRFDMKLSMPSVAADELPALAEKAAARIAARPAPPPRFRRAELEGRWRLLVAFEAAAPRVFDVVLSGRRFTSESSPLLSGSWGLWESGTKKTDSSVKERGTHVWLRVSREQSNCTLAGIADLPTHESFSLWGRPVAAESLQAELATRTEAGGVAASASGHLFAGTSIDKEWVLLGDWSLQRSRMAPGDWSLRDDPGV